MGTKLARLVYGEEGILWKGIDPNRNGWRRVTKPNQFRYGEKILSLNGVSKTLSKSKTLKGGLDNKRKKIKKRKNEESS